MKTNKIERPDYTRYWNRFKTINHVSFQLLEKSETIGELVSSRDVLYEEVKKTEWPKNIQKAVRSRIKRLTEKVAKRLA